MGILKRILGHKVLKDTIVDDAIYKNIPNSYCGGSLADSNILIVTNGNIVEEMLDSLVLKEEATFKLIKLSSLMNTKVIKEAGETFIGPFTHIINMVYAEDFGHLFDGYNTYNPHDTLYKIFQWHQQEVDYLVAQSQYATICTVFIGGDDIDTSVKKRNVEMLVKGLAEVLANHGMICNGIIADNEVPLNDIVNSSLFMSSKYGQVMSGEVLQLKNKM